MTEQVSGTTYSRGVRAGDGDDGARNVVVVVDSSVNMLMDAEDI